MAKPIFVFEGLELDTAKREIRAGARRKGVTPRVFDVLEYLVRHRDSLVSRDELIAALWRGAVVTESSVVQAIRGPSPVGGMWRRPVHHPHAVRARLSFRL